MSPVIRQQPRRIVSGALIPPCRLSLPAITMSELLPVLKTPRLGVFISKFGNAIPKPQTKVGTFEPFGAEVSCRPHPKCDDVRRCLWTAGVLARMEHDVCSAAGLPARSLRFATADAGEDARGPSTNASGVETPSLEKPYCPAPSGKVGSWSFAPASGEATFTGAVDATAGATWPAWLVMQLITQTS